MRFIPTSLLAATILTGCCSLCRTPCSHDQGVPVPAPMPEPSQAMVFPNVSEVTPETLPEPIGTTGGPLYGHADDYSWLVGELQRLHMPKAEWKLRFARLDEEDRWGGSVLLAPDIRLEGFKDGDEVYIEGEILVERPSLYISGPLYRIRAIKSSAALLANPVTEGG